jgi:hemin uptake protein HemP
VKKQDNSNQEQVIDKVIDATFLNSSLELLQIESEKTPNAEFVFNAADLLRGNTEAQIRHGSMLYRLRLTRSGKLILIK